MIPPKEQIPSIRVTIPYYLTGAVSFLLISIMCLVAARNFTGHYFQPQILAITHLAVFGWGIAMIFGASNQLAPVISEKRLYNDQLPVWVLLLLTSGTVLLVASFYKFSFDLMTYIGSSFLLLAITLHAANIYKTFCQVQLSIVARLIIAAHIWLILTVVIGYTLLLNLRFSFLANNHLQYLKVHACIGMAGWFLQLVIGVSARLVPMFLLSRKEDKRLLHVVYYMLNSSLIIFLVNDIWIRSLKVRNISFVLLLGAFMCYVAYVVVCYRTALRKHLDQGMKLTFISLLFMSILFALSFANTLVGHSYKPNMIIAFGFAFFAGFVSTIIMGQTFKTLPFIVWMHVTSPNKLPEVMPKDLFNERWVKGHMLLYLPGFLSFLSGILFKQTIMLYTGSVLMVVASAWYLLHVSLVVSKLWRYD